MLEAKTRDLLKNREFGIRKFGIRRFDQGSWVRSSVGCPLGPILCRILVSSSTINLLYRIVDGPYFSCKFLKTNLLEHFRGAKRPKIDFNKTRSKKIQIFENVTKAPPN